MKPALCRFGCGLLLSASLIVVGCKSKEDQLVDARLALNQKEDALYQTYGGSDVAAAVSAGAQQANPGGANADPAAALVAEVFANGAKELDRDVFSEDCRNVGHGQRVPFFTEKGRAFFARPETMETCRQIAQLADTVGRLETELGVAPSPTSVP